MGAIEVIAQPLQQHGGTEQAHARRRQFQRERQAVEAPAEFGDRRGVVRGEREPRVHLPGPGGEQLRTRCCRALVAGRARAGPVERDGDDGDWEAERALEHAGQGAQVGTWGGHLAPGPHR